jgi:hypothetical protein
MKINEVYDRVVRNDVKYRLVIDMASLKNRISPDGFAGLKAC